MTAGFFIVRRTVACWVAALAGSLLMMSVALADSKTIFITSNGWHTGVVLAVKDVPDGVLPEIADFPKARYLEFGWGDAAYYPNRDAGLAQGLSAIMTKSPAVMHVVGLWGPPARVFPDAEVVELVLTPDQFAALAAYLHDSFDRADGGRVAAPAPGLYAFSLFYPAVGDFHWGNTCNHWTANALAVAGFDIQPEDKRRASVLMRAVRKLAEE